MQHQSLNLYNSDPLSLKCHLKVISTVDSLLVNIRLHEFF